MAKERRNLVIKEHVQYNSLITNMLGPGYCGLYLRGNVINRNIKLRKNNWDHETWTL